MVHREDIWQSFCSSLHERDKVVVNIVFDVLASFTEVETEPEIIVEVRLKLLCESCYSVDEWGVGVERVVQITLVIDDELGSNRGNGQ